MTEKKDPNASENRNTFFDEVPEELFEEKSESINKYNQIVDDSIKSESNQLTGDMLIELSLRTKK